MRSPTGSFEKVQVVRATALLILLAAAYPLRAQVPEVEWRFPVTEFTRLDAYERAVVVTGHVIDSAEVFDSTVVNQGSGHVLYAAIVSASGQLSDLLTYQTAGVRRSMAAAIDSAGNLFLGGGFQEQLVTPEGAFEAVNISDYFLIKYLSTGVFSWMVHGENDPAFSSEQAWVEDIDVLGEEVFVLGQNAAEQRFAARGAFAAKYSSDGDLAWGVRFNHEVRSAPTARAILADGEGGAYVAVFLWEGKLVVEDDTLAGPYPWHGDANALALIRLGRTGEMLWGRVLPGGGTQGAFLATRLGGGVYVGSAQGDTLYLDEDTRLPNPYAYRAFLAAFDEDGNLDWWRTPPDTLGGELTSGSASTGLATDGRGDLHQIIRYSGDGIGPARSAFLSYSPEGSLDHALPLSTVSSGPSPMAADGDDVVYAIAGQELLRIRLPRTSSGIADQPSDTALRIETLYPNPTTKNATVVYTTGAAAVSRLSIIDILGRERMVLRGGPEGGAPGTIDFSVEGLPGGVYFLRVSTERGNVVLPFVVVPSSR